MKLRRRTATHFLTRVRTLRSVLGTCCFLPIAFPLGKRGKRQMAVSPAVQLVLSIDSASCCGGCWVALPLAGEDGD